MLHWKHLETFRSEKHFFPSRYFLVLSISYSQPSSFFCQSFTHEEDESSRKRGQRRELQREVQYFENNLEVNEIRIAVFMCNNRLMSKHFIMSIFSTCCLGQDIVQTHFWPSLCFVLDPWISIHSCQHSPGMWAAHHIIAHLFLQWKQNGFLFQNFLEKAGTIEQEQTSWKVAGWSKLKFHIKRLREHPLSARVACWAVQEELLDVVPMGSVWLLPTESFVSHLCHKQLECPASGS